MEKDAVHQTLEHFEQFMNKAIDDYAPEPVKGIDRLICLIFKLKNSMLFNERTVLPSPRVLISASSKPGGNESYVQKGNYISNDLSIERFSLVSDPFIQIGLRDRRRSASPDPHHRPFLGRHQADRQPLWICLPCIQDIAGCVGAPSSRCLLNCSVRVIFQAVPQEKAQEDKQWLSYWVCYTHQDRLIAFGSFPPFLLCAKRAILFC